MVVVEDVCTVRAYVRSAEYGTDFVHGIGSGYFPDGTEYIIYVLPYLRTVPILCLAL